MTTTESTNDVSLRAIPVRYPLIGDAETIIRKSFMGWPLDIISTSPTREFGMRPSICLTNLMMLVVQTLLFTFNVSVISTRQRWENWKGTRGFWIISVMFFQGNWPIVISCLLQSCRRDLKNAIKGCRSQMKTFLNEYPDIMIIWTTTSTLDWFN